MLKKKQKKLLAFLGLIIALVLAIVVLGKTRVTAPDKINTSKQQSSTNKTGTFDKKAQSISDPASLWLVVNKKRPLNPSSHAPTDLVTPDIPLRSSSGSSEMQVRKPVADALKLMTAQASKESVQLMLASGYRSYGLQTAVYNGYVKTQGRAVADSQSARPGYSEHQSGLSADIEPASRQCEVEDCFASTPEGKWLATNAYKYGFIVRYPKDAQKIVGYKYEPWHMRYVGIELSTELHRVGNPPLEIFFGLPPAVDY